MEVKETFLCTFCGKGFTKKANLESHITLHTGEKRYSCTQCDKKFRSHSVYQVNLLETKTYLIVAKIVAFTEPSSVSQGQKGVCLHLLWKGIHAKVPPAKTHSHPHWGAEPRLPRLPKNFHWAWWREEAHENSQQRKHKVSIVPCSESYESSPTNLFLLQM